ncbi:MAG: hypothetical protein EA357_08720 [Micavibrio sp.]|jgi:hypothetical protein|nr:MAG: hypothetical protein EA357_08720 [Micavibrio sp.]
MGDNQQNKAGSRKKMTFMRLVFGVFCMVFIAASTVTVAPRQAHALTCETPVEQGFWAAFVTAMQEAAMTALQGLITNLIQTQILDRINDFLGTDMQLDGIDEDVRQKLADLWSEWLPGMQNMTTQLNVADIDKSRMWGEFFNAALQASAQRALQRREVQTQKELQPSPQMCVPDTINPVQLAAQETSRAAKIAMENEFYATGIGSGAMGMVGTSSAEGVEAVLSDGMQEYMDNYYDPNFNAGRMPPGAPSLRARDQYNVAVTLFGTDTIDMTDQENNQNVAAARRLLMGNPGAPNVTPSAVQTVQGRVEILNRRQYQARLNLYSGAIGDVAGNRASGAEAPLAFEELQEETGRSTTERAADNRPSYQEIKRSRMEQLWTPRYMVELNESQHSAVQKQIDLYMMQTIELRDMIRKMERMGMVISARLGQSQ